MYILFFLKTQIVNLEDFFNNLGSNTKISFIGSLIGSLIAALIGISSVYFTNKSNDKRFIRERKDVRKRNIPFLLIKLVNTEEYDLIGENESYGSLMVPISEINNPCDQGFIHSQVNQTKGSAKSLPIISIQNLSKNRLFNIIIKIKYKKHPTCVSKTIFLPILINDRPKYNLLYTDKLLLKYKEPNFEKLKKILKRVDVWGITETRDVVHYECSDFITSSGRTHMSNSLDSPCLKKDYKRRQQKDKPQRIVILTKLKN